jgi:chromosome condensin MukBEF complex kleisin-like MukF subunit
MIVRIMGEGQYRVDDAIAERLNELDDRAMEAIERQDEAELDRYLDEMAELVRGDGSRLPDDDLSPSDAVVPPSDLTLAETAKLLSEEGFIPDLSV